MTRANHPSTNELSVTPLRLGTPGNYKQLEAALADDLGPWPFEELAPGRYPIKVRFPTEVVALAGKATVVRDGFSVEFRSGQLLRAAPQTVTIIVRDALKLRLRTPNQLRVNQALAQLHTRLVGCLQNTPLGSFEPLVAANGWLATTKEKLLLFSAELGPLASALFAIPRAPFSIHTVQTGHLAQCRLDCMQSFQPTCAASSCPTDPISKDVLTRLRIVDWPELTLTTGSLENEGLLGDVAWVLLAEQAGALERREELFLLSDGMVKRWIPAEGGMLVNAAIGGSLGGSMADAADIETLAHGERIVDRLLSELWHQEELPSWVADYTHHPIEVPYPVPFLALGGIGIELSHEFREKWQVQQVRATIDGVLPVAHHAEQGTSVVQMRLAAHDGLTGSSTWTVLWSIHHEFIEWRFDVVSNSDEDLIVQRELLRQYD